jgi:RNA polymerase sigma-70 factor, ECF subfamily
MSSPLDIESLYADHFPRVFAFAQRMLGDEEAARDVAQDTFAALLGKPDSYRGESSPLTWILSIAKNLCRKRLSGTRERSFGDIEAIVDRYSAESPTAHSDIERRFYVDEVREGCLVGLLQCLPFMQRCVFVLNLLVGLPVADVSRALGKSPNSVRILLSRARSSMRSFLCENCSLMREGAKCSCDRMIGFSLERGLIGKYAPGASASGIESEIRCFKDELELYRSLPDPSIAVTRLIREGSYSIFAQKTK